MKKLARLIGGLVCLSVMKKPRHNASPHVINNYFITKSGGCSGSCGGHCSCGKH